MTRWSKTKSLGAFDPRALAHYRAAWGDPSRIHAMCEDYRAGATLDVEADRDDAAAGRTIGCPVSILSSRDYLVKSSDRRPLDIWRGRLAPEAAGVEIDSGHFVVEENPDATADALMSFL